MERLLLDKRFKLKPKFVDVSPETERLKDLDHFWIEIDSGLKLWRFSYVWDETTEDYIPAIKTRFHEPLLLLHGFDQSHTIFNYLAREYWYSGFRYIFSMDNEPSLDLKSFSQCLSRVIDIIKQITTAQRVSMIAISTGGVQTRFFVKFTPGADNLIRILAMVGSPHDKIHFLKNIENFDFDERKVSNMLDYLQDINSTITEKELYYLTQVNIGGTFWSYRDYMKSESTFVPLSDACNITVGQTHLSVHKHKVIYRVLKPILIPKVAIFKIRLLTISNTLYPIVFRFHHHGHIIQKYPKNGAIKVPKAYEEDQSKPFLLEVPVIMFTSYFSLDKPESAKIAIYLFKIDQLQKKIINKLEISLNYDALPRVDYFTLTGINNERVDIAIYTYIP